MKTSPLPSLSAEKLTLAQQAFREFHARCFWFMRPDAEIVAEEVPYLLNGCAPTADGAASTLPLNYAARRF